MLPIISVDECVQVVDTVVAARQFVQRKAVVAFSHQWLADDAPDPKRTHYRCMVHAIMSLAQRSGIPLERVLVWVEYR